MSIIIPCFLLCSCDKEKHTVFFIGDSTVRHGVKGDGSEGGRWGWASMMYHYLDTNKVNLENRALGGTSSRTFYNTLWPAVISDIQEGDFLFVQFGHNDGGQRYGPDGRARSSIPGIGEDTVMVRYTKPEEKVEVVHSYGWYIRQYVKEAQDKGATVFVCSPIPRNDWSEDGKTMSLGSNDYDKWAEEAAQEVGANFIDLNQLCVDFLEKATKEVATGTYYPATDHTHTTLDGAIANAKLVTDAVKNDFPKSGINKYFLKEK